MIEQVLAELNQCRSNPAAYSQKVARVLPTFKGKIMKRPGKIDLQTNEGAAVVQECIKALQGTHPLPNFRMSPGMSRAAQGHCDECGPVGHTGHDGVNGSTMDSRISDHGEWMGSIGENISFGCGTAEEIVQQLLIDDGVSSRGHRNNILNPQYQVIGIGFGEHRDMECMCTLTFAQEYTEGSGTAAAPASHSKPAARTGHPAAPSRPAAQEVDPETEGWPEGAVGLRTHTSVTTKGSRQITTITKEYTMQDGSKVTEEEVKTE